MTVAPRRYSGGMKKSEALNILGLSDGATDDQVKQAHRKLVIAHHPDKFPLDSPERIDAEELTKRINESRDVLLSRSWTPEFDPRRDARPYAGNPYAHPGYSSPYGSPAGRPHGGKQDPFASWPFGQGQGQTAYVWTSWDDAGTTGAGANPFDPFAPFRAAVPQKTPQEVLAEAARDLKSEVLVVVLKAAVLGVAALLGTVATGLFFYVVVSVVYGLWKRLGSCLIGLIVPLALVFAPLVFSIAPRAGAVTMGLGLAFAVALLFDFSNLRKRITVYRAARKAAA